jgi:hypothetical protein
MKSMEQAKLIRINHNALISAASPAAMHHLQVQEKIEQGEGSLHTSYP